MNCIFDVKNRIIAEKSPNKENPINGRATIKLALKAMFEEKIRYQNNGEDGSDSNAFLHAYWASLKALDISIDWAQRWTAAHEEDFNSVYTQMDLFNNSIGIDFVRANQHLTNDQLANSIEDLVDLGKAKKIRDGKLINSTKVSNPTYFDRPNPTYLDHLIAAH